MNIPKPPHQLPNEPRLDTSLGAVLEWVRTMRVHGWTLQDDGITDGIVFVHTSGAVLDWKKKAHRRILYSHFTNKTAVPPPF